MKPIPGWPGYFATDDGRVFSQRRVELNGRGGNHKSRLLANSMHNGYARVTLWMGTTKACMKVHRLVALAWHEKPTNANEVNHINGIRDDNRPENLEWVTPSENRIHQYRRLILDRDYWKERAQRADAFLRTLNLCKD